MTTPAHRPEYGDTPGWAVPTGDPREIVARLDDARERLKAATRPAGPPSPQMSIDDALRGDA